MRALVLLALTVGALACADTVTTPRKAATKAALDCRGGYVIVDGRSVCSDSL